MLSFLFHDFSTFLTHFTALPLLQGHNPDVLSGEKKKVFPCFKTNVEQSIYHGPDLWHETQLVPSDLIYVWESRPTALLLRSVAKIVVFFFF